MFNKGYYMLKQAEKRVYLKMAGKMKVKHAGNQRDRCRSDVPVKWQ
jgi:hypothetical protein